MVDSKTVKNTSNVFECHRRNEPIIKGVCQHAKAVCANGLHKGVGAVLPAAIAHDSVVALTIAVLLEELFHLESGIVDSLIINSEVMFVAAKTAYTLLIELDSRELCRQYASSASVVVGDHAAVFLPTKEVILFRDPKLSRFISVSATVNPNDCLRNAEISIRPNESMMP